MISRYRVNAALENFALSVKNNIFRILLTAIASAHSFFLSHENYFIVFLEQFACVGGFHPRWTMSCDWLNLVGNILLLSVPVLLFKNKVVIAITQFIVLASIYIGLNVTTWLGDSSYYEHYYYSYLPIWPGIYLAIIILLLAYILKIKYPSFNQKGL